MKLIQFQVLICCVFADCTPEAWEVGAGEAATRRQVSEAVIGGGTVQALHFSASVLSPL